MSNNKHTQNDPERTLITLEQLSQTIEVMTNVVNRLRKHLSEQLQAQGIEKTSPGLGAENIADNKLLTHPQSEDSRSKQESEQESFVVEITQPEIEPVKKSSKILHWCPLFFLRGTALFSTEKQVFVLHSVMLHFNMQFFEFQPYNAELYWRI